VITTLLFGQLKYTWLISYQVFTTELAFLGFFFTIIFWRFRTRFGIHLKQILIILKMDTTHSFKTSKTRIILHGVNPPEDAVWVIHVASCSYVFRPHTKPSSGKYEPYEETSYQLRHHCLFINAGCHAFLRCSCHEVQWLKCGPG